MVAKIIDLHQYRSTVRCKLNGVPFPQIYRVTSFLGDISTGALIVTDKAAPVRYSLSQNDGDGLFQPTYETIRGFDPQIDDGWLIIRHHMSEALMEGYLDAIMDFREGDDSSAALHSIYRTKEGLFSLVHRKSTPNCPNHLVMYITKVPDSGDLDLGWIDHWTIMLPDGSISEDSNLLYPQDED